MKYILILMLFISTPSKAQDSIKMPVAVAKIIAKELTDQEEDN